MYRNLDKLLEGAKKKLRTEFNRLGTMGFDELNVTNTRKVTQAMFDRFLESNEALYLSAAKKAYSKAESEAKEAGFSGEGVDINAAWVGAILLGYNLVTGYLYKQEADRKRMRLNEQILTAREYDNRQMLNDSLKRTANLWWTQTTQYGVTVVDEAALAAYRAMGVRTVQWITAKDEKRCEVCGARDGKIYEIMKVPPKPHYGCRCRLAVVEVED